MVQREVALDAGEGLDHRGRIEGGEVRGFADAVLAPAGVFARFACINIFRNE